MKSFKKAVAMIMALSTVISAVSCTVKPKDTATQPPSSTLPSITTHLPSQTQGATTPTLPP